MSPTLAVRPALADILAGHLNAGLHRTSLRSGTMASGQTIDLPLSVIKGRHPGPVLWLNGAVHGDEINGILAIFDFMHSVDWRDLAGAVVATPVSNVTALNARTKRVPQDDQDLDQSFPGSASGMLSQRLAHAVFEEIREHANVVINFHTMNPYFDSSPYAVYKDAGAGAPSEAELLAALGCFSPFVACRMSVNSGSELPGNNSGSLDYQCLKLGKLAFMVELGGGSRQEPAYVRAGVEGLRRLAAHLKMLPEHGDRGAGHLVRVTKRTHVFCAEGGFFRQHASAGTMLPAGEALGIVQSAFGETVETVSFDKDVMVIGIRTDPVVHSGDRVAFVGLEWDGVDVR
jgi:uncharacterized protein